jgi:spectinomycin phosphotransferase
MFIGAGIGGAWNQPHEAESFFRDYGDAAVDPDTRRYYRGERILEDVVAFSRQLLLTSDGGEDRQRALSKFAAQFAPGDVLDIALAT